MLCPCHGLTEHELLAASGGGRRSVKQTFRACGRLPRCGDCVGRVARLLRHAGSNREETMSEFNVRLTLFTEQGERLEFETRLEAAGLDGARAEAGRRLEDVLRSTAPEELRVDRVKIEQEPRK